MKIAIISDIHDNSVNLKKFLFWARDNNVKKIICCGDVSNRDTLAELAEGFSKEIFLIRGNVDTYSEKDLEKYGHVRYGGKQAVFSAGEVEFGFCHEPLFIDKILEDISPAFIFYGHTHKPYLSEKGKTKLANPGTLGGMFSRATFAYWDTDSGGLDLKILDLL